MKGLKSIFAINKIVIHWQHLIKNCANLVVENEMHVQKSSIEMKKLIPFSSENYPAQIACKVYTVSVLILLSVDDWNILNSLLCYRSDKRFLKK